MNTYDDKAKAAEAGRKGGLRKVPKGVARMTPERRREIALLGVEGRRKKRGQTKTEG